MLKITPISPDIEDYNLLDKTKIKIVKNKSADQIKTEAKSPEEIMNNFLYKDNEQEMNVIQEDIEIQQDPWLTKDYVGKPL